MKVKQRKESLYSCEDLSTESDDSENFKNYPSSNSTFPNSYESISSLKARNLGHCTDPYVISSIISSESLAGGWSSIEALKDHYIKWIQSQT